MCMDLLAEDWEHLSICPSVWFDARSLWQPAVWLEQTDGWLLIMHTQWWAITINPTCLEHVSSAVDLICALARCAILTYQYSLCFIHSLHIYCMMHITPLFLLKIFRGKMFLFLTLHGLSHCCAVSHGFLSIKRGVKNAPPSATKVSTDTQWHKWCSLWISALRDDELSPLAFFWSSSVTVRFLLGKLTVTLWEHTWDMLLGWTSWGISLACAHHEAQKRTPSSSFLEDRMLWALSEKVIFFFSLDA